MATLKQIAEQAGVSVSTVSEVLNGKYKETRRSTASRADRIRRIAADMHYRPNAAAQSVRRGRFLDVALLNDVNLYRTSCPRALLNGIMHGLTDHGLGLRLAHLEDSQIRCTADLPDLLQRTTIDGLLVNYHGTLPDGFEAKLVNVRVPTIWINADRETATVRPDDQGAGYGATQALLERGHRRISYVDLSYHHIQPVGRHYSRDTRYNGYCQAMRDAGLASDFITLTPDQSPNDWRTHLYGLFSSADRPTAVVCNSDPWRIVRVALFDLGMSIPRDLSLVAFADDPIHGPLHLATFVVPWSEIGLEAAAALAIAAESPDVADLPVSPITFQFVPGETIASPR